MKPDPGIAIEVEPGVYEPSDDTYLMLSAVEIRSNERVLEIGTGSGIIAFHCAKVGCTVTAVDVSEKALIRAGENARANGLKITFVKSDLFEKISGKFDVIIFNPPYLSGRDAEKLSGDEALPLVGGEMGHEVSARFLESAGPHLNPGGRIYLLTSSESSDLVLRAARDRFSMKKLVEKRMFFEVLTVVELKFANP